ncbi:MAG: substrate-binding domain-containing protein [Propionibacteriales bacterium]|nr:substrate-binding domain-containing protein [Propionibacteriales bacterium]
MKIKKPLILASVAGLALSTFAAITPAFADPVSGSYAAVGSDTLDASMNALANGTKVTGSTVRISAGSTPIGSFDAFGSSLIQTKPTGPYFVRPEGSGNGVNALIASIRGVSEPTQLWNGVNIGGQVDIARSSSGPTADANGKLSWVPYARDAVAYAYLPVAGHESDLANLTTAQLKGLYNGTITSIGSTTVNVMIPQNGSGTRKFFLKTIGVSSDSSCPLTVCSTSTTPENDASKLTVAGSIIPFSAANYIAQANGVQVNTIGTSGVLLGAPDGNAPFTGTGSSLVPASAFYNTSYGRDTYLVVEYARVTSGDAKYDATLAALVNSTSATSLTNFASALPSQPGSVKKKFGFLAPSSSAPVRANNW